MPPGLPVQMFLLPLVGLVGGLVLFARGLVGYRRGRLVGAIATSRLDALAAGEVRVTGQVEPLAATLVSPLQSRDCVWYRARAVESGRNGRELLDEERAVAFSVRDAGGSVRVEPRGARWEVAPSFDESDDLLGGEPAGLVRRTGPASTAVAEFDRDAAIASLLTVRPARVTDLDDGDDGPGSLLDPGAVLLSGRRRYTESRIEPGQVVTIVGQAVPWADLRVAPSVSLEPLDTMDQAVAADIAEARDAGILAASPQEAWGNAAIPGFGIGRPVSKPDLDPEATPLPLADPVQRERAEELFDLPDETLVLARRPGAELVIYAGPPQQARQRHDQAFLLGVVGACMSVVSVLALAAMLEGGL